MNSCWQHNFVSWIGGTASKFNGLNLMNLNARLANQTLISTEFFHSRSLQLYEQHRIQRHQSAGRVPVVSEHPQGIQTNPKLKIHLNYKMELLHQ